ncbi:MAG: hypothetical protein QM800_12985 [Paludibacter sp.]
MKNQRYRKMRYFLLCILSINIHLGFSQVILNSDGPGNTYELINSILAPGNMAVENAECAHPEFGRHITEVWDSSLNQYVFKFHIHVKLDNDRCINFDRQRVEIKTYEPSPENLKGVSGETVVYKWRFKLPSGFQPSANFSHIHQVKAVGGDDDDPIFTLTVRKASPNRIELIHNNTTKVTTADLSLFEGNWVEATERIKIDSIHGAYSMTIKKISSGATILSYSNNNLMTIRYNNTFIRPKWGIYRSLGDSANLRDESLYFAAFSIYEEPATATDNVPANKKTAFEVMAGKQLRTFKYKIRSVRKWKCKIGYLWNKWPTYQKSD